MLLPPELRVLCFQLSSTTAHDLPRLLPTLVQHILRCQDVLRDSSGSGGGSNAKTDASAGSVLVHKLKTQLSTLLNGKSAEGRFAAVVLIKTIVDIGGWEVLQGVELWVRGLLTVLAKSDPVSTKELCVMTLTKIYYLTQSYQTLMREITTPTLPTFITSCLNLVSKASTTSQAAEFSLQEIIFQAFTLLLPRHTTIYRPFLSQLRLVSRSYIAPTYLDEVYASSSLAYAARRLTVVLHLTAPKNTSGEEWARAMRELIKQTHCTSDLIFRAVIEDWESAVGYIADPVDVNQTLQGGGSSSDELPLWRGIYAGTERLCGLLELLAQYLKEETLMPVTIPVGALLDLVVRMLSIPIPTSDTPSGLGGARLHPAVDRDEKDGLWAGLPQIYVAALHVLDALSQRLQENFMSLASGIFEQLAWVFPYGKHSTDFRCIAYQLVATSLRLVGQSFDKPYGSKMVPIIKACCEDLYYDSGLTDSMPKLSGSEVKKNSNARHNADSYLRNIGYTHISTTSPDPALLTAAQELLPLFMSRFPQQYLDISMRSLIERTAVLGHYKDAMLASVLNPFVGKNGRALASILPHLTHDYAQDDIVEILLRPRMPLLPSKGPVLLSDDVNDNKEAENEDEVMELGGPILPDDGMSSRNELEGITDLDTTQQGLGPMAPQNAASRVAHPAPSPNIGFPKIEPVGSAQLPMLDEPMDDGDSDDESVHLTMQLDTDSESD